MDKQYYYKIRRMIKSSSNVFIMAHQDLDLDAIGSSLASSFIARKFDKETFIILNDKKHEAGVKKVLDLSKNEQYITSKEALKIINDKSLLIIVDVNKPSIMQDENLPFKFKNTIIIDHHEESSETFKSSLSIINPSAGSASEILCEFLYYFNYSIDSLYSTFLLAGIQLDTNDFTIKTSALTHYAAYFLIKNGASVKEVNILLKQDIEEYILRQKVITDVEIIHKTIAFAKGSNRITYKREELAKIADTILEFNNIETSYVIAKLDKDTVGVSARSIGNIDVGQVLSLMCGGGDRHNAAAKIKNSSIKQVEEKLKKILGEIK